MKNIDKYSYKKLCSKKVRDSLYREQNDDLYVTVICYKKKEISQIFQETKYTAKGSNNIYFHGYLLSMDKLKLLFYVVFL